MRSLLALAFLAGLLPPLHGEEVALRVARGVGAEELIGSFHRATGLGVLYPPATLKGTAVPARIDVALPRANAHDLLVFALATCQLEARRYPSGTDDVEPLAVVLPKSSLVVDFRLTGLDLPLAFDRGPAAWRTPKDLAGSLADETVRALLETLERPAAKAGRARASAARLLGYCGPRSTAVARALAGVLGDDAAVRTAAWALGRCGHAARPVLPDLKQAIQHWGARHADALQHAVREIERSLHPSLLDPSLARERAPECFTVRLETTRGAIEIEVTRDWSPLAADRFFNLVRIGFYDGAPFYRVIRGFVAQFGKHPDPRVNRAWYTATIPGERPLKSNGYGYVTFAKTNDPDSRSTVVFINLKDNVRLDKPEDGFAPFGRVVRGMKVVEKLYSRYGERPDANRIHYDGVKYLEENFPELDYIKQAVLVEEEKKPREPREPKQKKDK